MRLEPGLTATVTLVVAEADTALALRSGDVPVLGTPRVISLAEEATVQALAGVLPEGRTTVGYQVGDAALLYAATLGPLWQKAGTRTDQLTTTRHAHN